MTMPAIPMKEAVERLARAVEEASSEDLVQYYAELYPEKPLPDVSGVNAAVLATVMAAHIREGIEPEEVVDLWYVIFPTSRNVCYDVEDGTLRYNEMRLNYVEL
jgi:hypothetical protein